VFSGDKPAVKRSLSPRGIAAVGTPEPAEASAIHTRILRLALALEESRAYWEHVDPAVPAPQRAKIAFEQRWFGGKSLDRVRYLVAAFVPRYDAFPGALSVLRRWPSMDLAARQAICHWHLQLSDPLYRRFTGECLPRRSALHEPKVDRDAVLRWVKAEYPDSWSEATCVQFASKLLSASLEAGLVAKRDPRALLFPKVPDQALAYLLYLLRETQFDGSLTNNPYLISVGLDEDGLAQRARALPGVTLRRMMGLVELDWAYPDLETWAREVAP
jgi:hypothetical protein